MDNAIDAVKDVSQEEKRINLRIKVTNSNLFVLMENPYSKELHKRNGHYLTTKPDKEEHGLGLRMVEDIVERHHGSLDINDEMNRFKVKLFVYDIIKPNN